MGLAKRLPGGVLAAAPQPTQERLMVLLKIHQQRLVQADGADCRIHQVDCPADGRVIDIEACNRCGYSRGEAIEDEDDRRFLECERVDHAPAAEAFETTLTDVPCIAIATRDTISVRPDTPVSQVREIMLKSVLGCVPVLDSSMQPIGIVTAEDLMRQPFAGSAEELMTAPVAAIPPTAPLTQASAIMAFEGIRHLCIVSESGVLEGIVSASDILRHIGKTHGFLMPERSWRQRKTQIPSGDE